MFRLFSRLSAGRHTTGSAATRRGLAWPQRMFSQAHPAAPGELMEIDSSPLDVLVMLDDGVPGRVELTGMIDVATRTVPAAVLRPSTRSVDASVLLARALTPEPMRPGWPASLAMAHSALPYERLLRGIRSGRSAGGALAEEQHAVEELAAQRADEAHRASIGRTGRAVSGPGQGL